MIFSRNKDLVSHYCEMLSDYYFLSIMRRYVINATKVYHCYDFYFILFSIK